LGAWGMGWGVVEWLVQSEGPQSEAANDDV
jgi:hypothetical protein